MPKKYTLGKKNRLYLKKQVDELFSEGSSFISYPLRIVFRITDCDILGVNDKVLVAVAKKYHKRANKRNRIKRLIRENYRLSKYELIEKLKLQEENKTIHIAIMCVSSEMPQYDTITKAINKAYKKIISQLK